MGKIQNRAQKMWDHYLNLWNKLTGWKLFFFYALHYTLLFAFLSLFVFSDYFKSETTFLRGDGVNQYLVRLQYLRQTIRSGIRSLLEGNGWTIPLYDFRLGPQKQCWEVEPLQWLAVLWPQEHMDIFYDGLVLFRYYLCGLSFSLFGFYFKQKPLPIMIGAISYIFSGYLLWLGVHHPHFMEPIILLPLLIVGTEKVLRRETPFLFIAVVFVTSMTNFYLSCILAILTGVYMLLRLLTVYSKHSVRELCSIIGWIIVAGGIGIAMSCSSVLPILLQLLDTGRMGRAVTAFYSLWKYSSSHYQMLLTYFLMIPSSFNSYTNVGFSVLTLPSIFLLFFRKDREKRSLQLLFLVLTGFFFVPFVGYVMSGFNTVANRWCFAYALCVSAILMFEIPHFFKESKQRLLLIGIEMTAYFIICYFVVNHKFFKSAPFVLLACCAIIFLLLRALPKQYHKAFLPICLTVTCVSVCYSSYLLYSPDQDNYIERFTPRSDIDTIYAESQYESLYEYQKQAPDKDFYHVSGDNISLSAVNRSFYRNMNGLSFYSSIYYQPYMEWFREMELNHVGENIINYGILNHGPALTLANVKYYIVRQNGKEMYPYGFQKIGEIENNKYKDIILENQKFLPIGYTYDHYLSNEKYRNLFALEKQYTQAQAIILDQAPKSKNIKEASVTTDAKQISIAAMDRNGVSWRNGILGVKEADASITLSFQGQPNTETFLRVVNLDLTRGGSTTRRWNLFATTENTQVRARFAADAHVYSNGMKTQILDLGYSEDGYNTCTITFSDTGTVKLEDLQIWCQPMDNYEKHIDALREEVLENVETNWRGLTGNISVSKDKMLCIAIPYDEGWSAYVDGEKVKIYQANTAFMAVELSAGNHHVELRYWTPGLTAGIILSLIGTISLVILIIYWHKRKVTQK